MDENNAPSNDGSAQVWSSLFSAVGQLATPFAQTLAYGRDNATELQLAQERVRLAQINGSGPNDRRAALLNTSTLRDFLFGAPADPTTGLKSTSGFLMPAVIILALGGLLLYFVHKR